jgi:hypothetical protein
MSIEPAFSIATTTVSVSSDVDPAIASPGEWIIGQSDVGIAL